MIYEPLTISPVAAQCNGACGKGSSIECVLIDRCWPQKSSRWRLRSTLNLDSDKFRCFNHRDEFDSTVFLPSFRLVALLQSRAGQPLVTMMRGIYSESRYIPETRALRAQYAQQAHGPAPVGGWAKSHSIIIIIIIMNAKARQGFGLGQCLTHKGQYYYCL